MMNLRSADPYWLFQAAGINYTSLKEDLKAEVLVVGAGISGALAAYELIKAGCKVTIVTKDRVGMASTCASTSLLQYEIDTPLVKLIKQVGEKSAVRSYLLCSESIDELEKIHKAVGADKLFQRRKSLLLSSTQNDIPDLEEEFEARNRIGLKARWLNSDKVEDYFGFAAAGAIYSQQGAQTDVYQFTQKLIAWCVKHGAQVFDKTEIVNIRCNKRSAEIQTAASHKITAKHVVMATGYDSVQWINLNIARLHSTYVIISEPFKKEELWKDECLIWETARPYTYFRTTANHRIIVGGKDEPFFSSGKRDALIPRKGKQLLNAFHSKFPQMNYTIENTWAGTFGETRDGLPFIGNTGKLHGVYFALGYGGNGITFSQIAARIITDTITGKPNADKKIFAFDRLNYA